MCSSHMRYPGCYSCIRFKKVPDNSTRHVILKEVFYIDGYVEIKSGLCSLLSGDELDMRGKFFTSSRL